MTVAARGAGGDGAALESGARRSSNDLRTRISNHENRIIFNEERAEEFTRLVERYRGDVAGAEEKFRIAETQLHDTDTELEQITTCSPASCGVMEEKQAATAALTGQRQEAERAIYAASANDAARIESRISGLRGQISSVMQQRDGAEARLSILSGELEQLTFAFAEFTDAAAATRRPSWSAPSPIWKRARRTRRRRGSSCARRRAASAAIDRELRDAQRTLAEKESKLEVLRALNEGGEGFSQGTQAVLRGLDNPEFFKPAVHGRAGAVHRRRAGIRRRRGSRAGSQSADDRDEGHDDRGGGDQDADDARSSARPSLALRELDRAFRAPSGSRLTLPEGALDWLINKIKPQPEVQRARRAADQSHRARARSRDGAPHLPAARLGDRHARRRGADRQRHPARRRDGRGGELACSQRKNQIHALEAEAARLRAQVDGDHRSAATDLVTEIEARRRGSTKRARKSRTPRCTSPRCATSSR